MNKLVFEIVLAMNKIAYNIFANNQQYNYHLVC